MENINSLFSKFLMASYLYYERKVETPWSDAEFDRVCKTLIDRWDDIEHIHKYLVNVESLKCQTGFDIKYPLMVKYSAMDWLAYGEEQLLEKEGD